MDGRLKDLYMHLIINVQENREQMNLEKGDSKKYHLGKIAALDYIMGYIELKFPEVLKR